MINDAVFTIVVCSNTYLNLNLTQRLNKITDKKIISTCINKHNNYLQKFLTKWA